MPNDTCYLCECDEKPTKSIPVEGLCEKHMTLFEKVLEEYAAGLKGKAHAK